MLIIKPVKAYQPDTNTLDYRGVKLYGIDLADSIRESVEATQKPIMLELPNVLMLSHKQFASLVPDAQKWNVKNQLFRTPLNVMDVAVDIEMEPLPVEQEQGK